MRNFEEYATAYPHAKLERRSGILQITFHTEGGGLKWHVGVHEELSYLFRDVANDRDNEVVILTGAGKDFGVLDTDVIKKLAPPDRDRWDAITADAKNLMMGLLDISVPVIGAFNGPCYIRPDLFAVSDIVLATEDTTVSDQRHFVVGIAPGDGIHVVWPLLLGFNRGRRYLLTGESLTAQELKEIGVVAEVLPRERLVARAWELAETVLKQPRLTRRFARTLMIHELRRRMADQLPLGLALQGFTFIKQL